MSNVETVTYASSLGGFKLVIVREVPGIWNIHSAAIHSADDVVKVDLPSTSTGAYPSFRYQFFCQGEVEWLWYRLHYTQQHFVNLTTGQIYTTPLADAFCWATLHFNPEGTLLAVEGCIWAAPYELRFYDLREIETGWSEIRVQPCPFYELYLQDDVTFKWLDSTRFELERTQAWSELFEQPFDTLTEAQMEAESQREAELGEAAVYIEKVLYRVVLRFQSKSEDLPNASGSSNLENVETPISINQMVYETIEPSPIYLEQIETLKIHQAKVAAFDQNFPSNTRYRAFKAAFPESNCYLFYYKGVHQDVDSPIEAVHFGLNVSIGKVVYSVQSYPHKTTVAPGAYRARGRHEVYRFETTAEAITYLEDQRSLVEAELSLV